MLQAESAPASEGALEGVRGDQGLEEVPGAEGDRDEAPDAADMDRGSWRGGKADATVKMKGSSLRTAKPEGFPRRPEVESMTKGLRGGSEISIPITPSQALHLIEPAKEESELAARRAAVLTKAAGSTTTESS
jgi:hypothetical protein